MNLVIRTCGRQEKFPDHQNGQCIENFVPVVAVTKQKAVPSIEFSSGTGNFEPETMEDTMLDLVQPFTEGLEVFDVSSSIPKAGGDMSSKKNLDDELPSVVTDTGERYSGKRTPSVREESSVPKQEETTKCSLIIRKIPIVKSV